MIFSEIYSAYYKTVAKILKQALSKPTELNEIRRIVSENAFAESLLAIEPSITSEKWQLIKADGTTPLKKPPRMPLTTLEKRWLKAISLDKRIRLFGDNLIDIPDAEPLFTADDIFVFDKYADGDPFEDEGYIERFRFIMQSIKDKRSVEAEYISKSGERAIVRFMPRYMEYSEKDDKFRVVGLKGGGSVTLNLSKIISATFCRDKYSKKRMVKNFRDKVEFELVDERNALERVLLHFADLEKQAVKLDEKRYRITLSYDVSDETEIVIRLLSFGPMIRVTAPESFAELIKERLISQKSLGL